MENWQIDYHELLELSDFPILIDIRDEWETQKIIPLSGSIVLDYFTVFTEISKFPIDKKIILICSTGIRSATLTEALRMSGYNNVFNLRSGLDSITLLMI